MNYLLFNLLFFVGVSSLAVTHEREIHRSLHYIEKNWQGIAATGYEKFFKQPMPSVNQFDEMTRFLTHFQ